MKDKLIGVIREVPIADKTYPEYIEAIAEKLLSQRIFVLPKGTTSAAWTLMNSSDTKYMAYPDGRIEPIPSKTDVAREIFEEIEALMNEVYSSVQYGCYSYGMTKQTDSPSAQRQCGKLEGVKCLGDRIAELKKKYTEEGK